MIVYFCLLSEKNPDSCFREKFASKEGGSAYNSEINAGLNLTQCQEKCLDMNESCKSLTHYTLASGTPICLIFSVVIAETNLTFGDKKDHYNKNCPTGK